MNQLLRSILFIGLMHKRITLGIVLLMMVGQSWGQILTFDFAGLAGSEVSANSNFNTTGINSSTITRGSGLTASVNADRFNATNWALTSIANAVTGNNYMEFSIAPVSGNQFSVSSIVINIQRSGTGPSAVALRSSIDGYIANLGGIQTIIDNTATQTFTFTFAQSNTTSTVTYRFYMYAEALLGSGGIGDGAGNDLIVNGTVTSTGASTITLSSSNPSVPAGSIQQGSTNNVLHRLDIAASGASATLSGLQIPVVGTFVTGDITNLKAWYSTDATFSSGTDVLLSTISSSITATTLTFPAFASNPTIGAGSTGYVFITTDLPCTATTGNNIWINTIANGNTTFTVAPTYNTNASFGGGVQTIATATPNNVTGLTASPGNGQVSVSWTAPAGCYDEVIIVAHTASITGTPTGTYTAASTSYTNGSNPAFPGGGVVVYNGSASPQIITSLTNGILYYFKVFTRRGSNWSSGVQVSATPVMFIAVSGDYRPKFAGVDFSTNNNWETYNGSSWVDAATAPQNLAPASRPARIIIDKLGITAGGSASNTYNDIIIISGGELYLVDNDAPPVAAEFLNANKIIEVQAGGKLFVQGDIDLPATGSLIVRNGATITIDQNTINNLHPMWEGVENFESGSTFEILNWGFTGTGLGSLMNIYGTISDNLLGYKFGILTANINPGFSWVLVGGSLTVNLCEVLNISNASSNPVSITSNNTNPSVTIGTINHNSGLFGLTGSFSGGASQTVTITGNLNSNAGTLRLYYSGGGSASSINVNLAGNLTIASGVTVSNDGGTGANFNFNGTSTQYVDVTPNITGWPMYVKANAYVAQSRNISLATGSSLNIDLNGTFDNNGEYQITSGGGAPSISIDGRFITRDAQGFSGTGAAIPGIAPVLNTGCTIEYGRAGDQAVQSRNDYSNITFSNSGTKTLASACNPAGTVYITGTAIFEQSNNTFGNSGTSLTMDGGRYRLSGTGSKPDIGGTYSLTAGVIEFYNSLATPQTIRGTNDASASITYYAIEVNGANVGQGNANINLASGGSFTIKNGGVFTNNADAIVGTTGTQTLTIETGGRFVTGNLLGFYGALDGLLSPSVRNNIENIVFQTNSTVEYSRASAQSLTPAPVNYRNLIISGGGMKTLTGAVTMEEVLTLTNGLLTSEYPNLLTLSATATCPAGGSSSSFVNGPMRKFGSAAFNFPVGKLVNGTTPHYRYIGLGDGGLDTDEFYAEFHRKSSYNRGAISAVAAAAGLQRVSYCEHWSLIRTTGTAQRPVTLTWTDQSRCNTTYVTDVPTLVVVPYGSSAWGDDFGGTSSSPANPGAAFSTITWTTPSNYLHFTLGSIDVNQNPLPFLLNTFNAKPKQTAIQLDWAVGNNHQQQQYILERGANAQVFETITTVNAKQGATIADYVYDDAKPLNGWNYYRLRAIGTDGKSNSSSIIKVWWGKGVTVNVLPNPATEKIVINLSEPSSIKEIQIVNAMGQVMRNITTVQFFNEVNISSMQAGIYYIRFLGENGLTTRSFVKQ